MSEILKSYSMVYVITVISKNPLSSVSDDYVADNIIHAKMFARCASSCGYSVSISYKNKYFSMLKEAQNISIYENNIGHRFILGEKQKHNAVFMSIIKMSQNKYLKAYSGLLNNNGESAILATITATKQILQRTTVNREIVNILNRLMGMMLNDRSVDIDYFTYATLSNKQISAYRIE